jgi:nucleotide-binding universal stress UspA family protein
MAQKVFIAAFDGHDRHAVECAIDLVRCCNGRLIIAHVLHWSPYTFLTNEELSERHRAREAELERAKATVLNPIVADTAAKVIAVEGVVRHGQTVDVLCDLAREMSADMIVVGRSSSFSSRMFGWVTSALAQDSPVPVVIVP